MSRLMSIAYTEQAVRNRTKTVTRRKGWLFAKPGDRITLCRKVMGRKKGEPLERIVDVEIVSVLRLPLHYVTAPGELTKEGFPELEAWPGPFQGAQKFIERYFEPQGLGWEDEVTRIEWRYLDDTQTPTEQRREGKVVQPPATAEELADGGSPVDPLPVAAPTEKVAGRASVVAAGHRPSSVTEALS